MGIRNYAWCSSRNSAYSTRSNLEPGAPLLWTSDGGFLAAIHWVEWCFTEIRSVPCARAHLRESRLRPVSEWGTIRSERIEESKRRVLAIVEIAETFPGRRYDHST